MCAEAQEGLFREQRIMAQLPVPVSEPWSGRWVGAGVRRLEDPRLLAGNGLYVDDVRQPGTLEVAFLRSPYAHAAIRAIDTSVAEQMAGVQLVVHGASAGVGALPGIQPRLNMPDTVCPARPVLARGTVRFAGEAVAAVVAESRYRAEDALDAIAVEYEPYEVVVDAEAALRPGAARLHAELPDNRYLRREIEIGPVDECFARADVLVDWRRFDSPRVAGSPIEPRGVLATCGADGRVTLWASTQVPHRLREVVAELLGLDEQAVRVVTTDVGGGFGIKAQVYPEEVVVAWLALQLGAPVKWIEDRREHLLAAGHAREQIVRARLAATRDGCVTAIDAEVVCDIGAWGNYPFGPGLEPLGTSSMIPGPYDIRAYRCRVQAAATNKAPEGPYRGVGLPVATFVHERLMDLLAHELGLEPDEVRRRNLVATDAFPYSSVTGMVYESGNYVACLDRALEAVDLPTWRARQAAALANGGDLRLGIGIGCYVEYTGLGSGTFKRRGMLSLPGSDGVRLRVESDGTVTAISSLSDMGQGLQTTLRQLVADGLGLPLEATRFENTDTDVAPRGTGTFASRSAVVGAGAAWAACGALRQRLLEAAAEQLEVSPDDLELVDGQVRVRGLAYPALTLADLARRAPNQFDVAAEYDPPPATFPNAVHVGVIEVDTHTGATRFRAYVVAEDCGRLINPLVVDGQIHGATAQGIGGGLLEELRYNAQGQLVNASLMDYLLPTATDVPHLRIQHLQTPTPHIPGGFKGVGEGGTLAPPAVIANAISDALGRELNGGPATPERVLALCKSVSRQ